MAGLWSFVLPYSDLSSGGFLVYGTTEPPTAYVVKSKGAELFSEGATTIAVDDDAAGPFIVLSQCPDEGEQRIRIDFGEWDLITRAVKKLAKDWDK